MEELKLFLELGNIKSEINEDLNKLDKIMNDLDFREIYGFNQELSEKINYISKDFKEKMQEINNKNNLLEKEILRLKELSNQKDSQIEKLNSQLNYLSKEKRKVEENFVIEKNNNEKLNNQIVLQNDVNILLEENKNAIFNLYFNK